MPAPVSKASKRRVARRRGRAAVDSDEEIEREAASDSDADSVQSSDSESDSESDLDHAEHVNPKSAQKSFFAASGGDWSDMVNAEQTNGVPEDLPVVDFADLNQNGHISPSRDSAPKTILRKSRSPSPQLNGHATPSESAPLSPHSSSGRGGRARRPLGQSARQAYQTRLEKDPSYVPTVGEFWGHDDRLLDKDLRSLSHWWRGKWQNRARGFDARRAVNGRGRGGFGPGRIGTNDTNEPDGQDRQETQWSHDGFEEMKKREEIQRMRTHGPRGGFASRGGRAASFVAARGRGSFQRGGLPFAPARIRPPAPADRPWFSMKPEQSWTKQHEGFLFQDQSSRWNPGQVVSLRVKLGDKPPRSSQLIVPDLRIKTDNLGSQTPPTEDESFTVRLPPPSSKPSQSRQHALSRHLEAAPNVPQRAPAPLRNLPPHMSQPVLSTEQRTSSPPLREASVPVSHTEGPSSESVPEVDSHGFIHPLPIPQDQPPAQPVPAPEPSQPPHPQTSVPYQSPVATSPYDSPYGYSASLPPGIGINHFGQAFEIATGRPVYLPPSAPQQMYMPPPAPPAQPQPVAAHARHYSSVTPDFVHYMQQPPPAPPPQVQTPQPQVDPSTYFSYPRQSSKVDLKRPDGTQVSTASPPASAPARPSHKRGLSVAAPIFEPTKSQSPSNGHGTPSTPPQELYPMPHVQQNPYESYEQPDYAMYQQQQAYYYPEAAYYGSYPTEMYPPDSQYQSTTYYQQQ